MGEGEVWSRGMFGESLPGILEAFPDKYNALPLP